MNNTQQTDCHQGLSDEQVLIARNRYGRNEIENKSSNGFLSAVAEQIKEPMLILLVVASVIYFLTGSVGEGTFMLGLLF